MPGKKHDPEAHAEARRFMYTVKAQQAREAGKLAAKREADLERARAAAAERAERLRIAAERANVPVTAPDAAIWDMLIAGSMDEVAEHLGVTQRTLAAWMMAPERAGEYQALLAARGLVAAFAVKGIGQDDSRDPQSRAVDGKFRQWEAERMNKRTFGRPEDAPPVVSGPVIDVTRLSHEEREELRSLLSRALGRDQQAIEGVARVVEDADPDGTWEDA